MIMNAITITKVKKKKIMKKSNVRRTQITKMRHWKYVHHIIITLIVLKELRNCIPQIIRVWSLFCSIWVYKSPHFLPILLENWPN